MTREQAKQIKKAVTSGGKAGDILKELERILGIRKGAKE